MLNDIDLIRATVIGQLSVRLALHARADACAGCAEYVHAVTRTGAKPAEVMHLRCDAARGWAAELTAVVNAAMREPT